MIGRLVTVAVLWVGLLWLFVVAMNAVFGRLP